MTVFKEPTLAYEALISEAPGYISRDTVTLKGGNGVVKACTVLGQVTTSKKYVPSPATGTDGSQTAVAMLLVEADTSAGDVQVAIIRRTAEVVAGMLNFDASINTPELIAGKLEQLAAVGIVAR